MLVRQSSDLENFEISVESLSRDGGDCRWTCPCDLTRLVDVNRYATDAYPSLAVGCLRLCISLKVDLQHAFLHLCKEANPDGLGAKRLNNDKRVDELRYR